MPYPVHNTTLNGGTVRTDSKEALVAVALALALVLGDTTFPLFALAFAVALASRGNLSLRFVLPLQLVVCHGGAVLNNT